MTRILIILAILALAFRQGASIKCYMCTTQSNEHCGDPMDTSQLTTVDCNLSKAKDFIGALSDLTHATRLGDMFPAGADPVDMACQKMKYSDSNGKDLVFRACILADSSGICSPANAGKEGFFCEQCKTDGCNGVGQLAAISVFFYLLIPCIIALVTLRS